jgi:hypothetical protein
MSEGFFSSKRKCVGFGLEVWFGEEFVNQDVVNCVHSDITEHHSKLSALEKESTLFSSRKRSQIFWGLHS